MRREPPSTAHEWRRFASRLLLLLWPVLVFCALFEVLAWRVGETMPMDRVAAWQSAGPDRMWRGGDGRSYLTYKVARVRLLKPDIIVVGQSRANSFNLTDGFAPYSFYNAGLTSWTFDHYRRFIELVSSPGYTPKALIFNLDYWMFSQGFDHYWVDRFYEQPASHWEDLKIIADQLITDPLTLFRRLPHADNVRGLYAVLSGDGFRENGSLFGQPQTPDPQRLRDDGTGVGVPPVELGDRLSQEQRDKFERFVALARSKGIVLVGIQVPFYAKILNGLNADPRTGMWRQFESEATRRYFADQGVIFFDFADMPEYRDKPEYFVDSLHPDARIIRRIVDIVRADPRVDAALPNLEAPR